MPMLMVVGMVVRVLMGMIVGMVVSMVMAVIVRVFVGMIVGVTVGLVVRRWSGVSQARGVAGLPRKESEGFDKSRICLFNQSHAVSYLLRRLNDSLFLKNLCHFGVTLQVIQVMIDPMCQSNRTLFYVVHGEVPPRTAGNVVGSG